MTRVNVVPPEELCDQHLLAELREITRIPNKILYGNYKLDGQPKDYVLGTGHVKFFYDKLSFLRKRHVALTSECKGRGFKVQSRWPILPYETREQGLWNDYTPTAEALAINRARITERMPKKPRFTPYTAYSTVYAEQRPTSVVGKMQGIEDSCAGWRPVLQAKPAKLNFVFLSGDVNFLSNVGDRRFMVVDHDTAR